MRSKIIKDCDLKDNLYCKLLVKESNAALRQVHEQMLCQMSTTQNCFKGISKWCMGVFWV